MEYQSRAYAPPPAAQGGPPVTFTKGVENVGNYPRPGQPALTDSTPFSSGPVVCSPTTPTGTVTPATASPAVAEPLENLPHPRIVYQPGTVSDPPELSVGDIHNPKASPSPTVSPSSNANIGALGSGFPTVDQGIQDIDGVGHHASGIRPSLAPYHEDLPATELPTSAINQDEIPWQAEEPGRIPPKYTNPFFSSPDGYLNVTVLQYN